VQDLPSLSLAGCFLLLPTCWLALAWVQPPYCQTPVPNQSPLALKPVALRPGQEKPPQWELANQPPFVVDTPQ